MAQVALTQHGGAPQRAPKRVLQRIAQPPQGAQVVPNHGGDAPVDGPLDATGVCRQTDATISAQSHAPAIGREWSPAAILNVIDERIMEARGESEKGIEPGIQKARENIIRILNKRRSWRRPLSINADARSEILIVWGSPYGRVEIDTDEAGEADYYVKRVAEDNWREGRFDTYDADEVERVMSWLDAQEESW